MAPAAEIATSLKGSRVTKLSIKQFDIIELIGRGGFGKVYKAVPRTAETNSLLFPNVVAQGSGEENRRPNDDCYKRTHKEKKSSFTPVAIKVMNKAWLKKKGLYSRVRYEIKIHSSLPLHPRIIQVLGSFSDATHIYLVLELCSKGNLYHYFRRHRPLSADIVRQWFKEIVEGLNFLHSKCNVVHRDLKLSNVLITEDLHLKISDFGLATHIGDNYECHTICGTPNYMAPEIRSHDRKGEAYDPIQADMWSLGCLLYMLLNNGAKLGSQNAGSNSKYCRTEKIPDSADDLLKILLNQEKDRSNANAVLSHPYLNSLDRKMENTLKVENQSERLSYVRIDTGQVRGVQHVFSQHCVEICRNGEVIVATNRSSSNKTQKTKKIQVKEWMPSRYRKLQEFTAKAVNVLKENTPKVVLKIVNPEPMVVTVIKGIGHAWLPKRKVHAEYDLAAPKPEIKIGTRSFMVGGTNPAYTRSTSNSVSETTLNSAIHTLSLPSIILRFVFRCLEIEVELVRKCPSSTKLHYPVIVNDDQVSVRGVGTGMRTSDGDVNLYLDDGTSIALDKTASVVTWDDQDYALLQTKENSALPRLPSHLRCKLGKANMVIGQLMHV